MRGLIAGVLGGAARGYTQMAEGELKKQQELDLRTQLMEAETEKQLRIDEIKRKRDIDEETRKMSPKYLEQVGAAELTKGQISARNRKTLAPDTAAAEAAELEAGAPNIKRKAQLTGEAEGTAYTSKVKTPGFTEALTTEAKAKRVAPIEGASTQQEAQRKAEIFKLRQKLSETTDPQQRQVLGQQIKDLEGAAPGASRGDPLSSYVAAARAVLADLDASEEEKAAARQFLSGTLQSRNVGGAPGATVQPKLPIGFRSGGYEYTGGDPNSQSSWKNIK